MRVRIYGHLKSLVNEPEIEIYDNVETLKDLLLKLKERFGETFYNALVDETSNNTRVGIILTINGIGVALEGGLNTKLKNDDGIYIDTIGPIPPEGGEQALVNEE